MILFRHVISFLGEDIPGRSIAGGALEGAEGGGGGLEGGAGADIGSSTGAEGVTIRLGGLGATGGGAGLVEPPLDGGGGGGALGAPGLYSESDLVHCKNMKQIFTLHSAAEELCLAVQEQKKRLYLVQEVRQALKGLSVFWVHCLRIKISQNSILMT